MASSATALYEKLGVFYLGKPFDLATNTLGTEPVLYDSKDLVTHAVIVGMTGSGKTGLGLSLIEEAAMDGVPVLAIDPKGDLGNLLLTFPNLAAGDFKPWVDRRRGRAQGHHRRRVRRAGSGDLEEGPRGLGPGRRAHRPPARRRRLRHLHAGQPRRASGVDPRVVQRAVRGRARGQRADGGSGDDHGDQRADAARRRRRSGPEPRAHPAVGDPERRVVQGREPRSRRR